MRETIRFMRRTIATVLVLGCGALPVGCGDDPSPTAVTAGGIRGAPLPTPTATVRATTSKKQERRRFKSINQALAAIARRVDVPVALPTNFPDGTKLAADPSFYGRTAQLTLVVPRKRILTIQYGKAGFDGCGPLHPREVKVADIPAVIESYKHGKRPYTTLVWPATLEELVGRYGLSGEFTASRMLAFAASMHRARAITPAGPKNGC